MRQRKGHRPHVFAEETGEFAAQKSMCYLQAEKKKAKMFTLANCYTEEEGEGKWQ